ncbi:hypothetical protein DFH09DRAFT_1294736 [Mycena vulgaris]|nr:hypothetical protein DFH09DRAFT_1294736 [Mycena vulgaris]
MSNGTKAEWRGQNVGCKVGRGRREGARLGGTNSKRNEAQEPERAGKDSPIAYIFEIRMKALPQCPAPPPTLPSQSTPTPRSRDPPPAARAEVGVRVGLQVVVFQRARAQGGGRVGQGRGGEIGLGERREARWVRLSGLAAEILKPPSSWLKPYYSSENVAVYSRQYSPRATTQHEPVSATNLKRKPLAAYVGQESPQWSRIFGNRHAICWRSTKRETEDKGGGMRVAHRKRGGDRLKYLKIIGSAEIWKRLGCGEWAMKCGGRQKGRGWQEGNMRKVTCTQRQAEMGVRLRPKIATGSAATRVEKSGSAGSVCVCEEGRSAGRRRAAPESNELSGGERSAVNGSYEIQRLNNWGNASIARPGVGHGFRRALRSIGIDRER